ncbi:hypothetical protein Dimus_020801 [Dionaea muscipula]
MKRAKVNDEPESSSRHAASSQQTQEHEITDFNPVEFPSLTFARLWPKFEYCPIVCGRSVVLDAQYHFLLNDFVNAMGWGAMLTLPDKFYPMIIRTFYCNLTWTNGHHGIELHSYFLGNRLKITRPLLARWIGVELCENKTYFMKRRELQDFAALTHPHYATELVATIYHSRTTPGGIKRGDLHPRLLILHLWICSNVLPKKGHLDEVSPFEILVNTAILLDEELDETCGGPFNHYVITQIKVLKRINARVALVDVNLDDVDDVVNDLMANDRGNVNAPRRAQPSSMTPQMFVGYHRKVMESLQCLQTLGHEHITQFRSVAATQFS